MRKTLVLAGATLFAAPAFAQGADECSAAVDLGTGPIAASFDTNVCTDTGVAATTSVEQQCISLTEDVWFRYTAATTGLASFDTCNNATFDTEIGVWEGADCSTFVPLGCNDDNAGAGCTGNTSFLDNIPVTAGQTYYIQLGFWSTAGGTFGSGTLTINEFADPCAAVPADALEDNDDCASAVALTPGTTTGLNASLTDSDFYSVVIPAGESIFADLTFTNANGDLDLYLWDSSIACDSNIEGEGAATALALGFSATDNETASYANLTAAPITVTVEVDVWSGSATLCNDYDLTIAVGPDPCFTPDALEDNDDCSSAVSIGNGLTMGLNANNQDSDFYSVSVPSGGVLTVDAFFATADADLDVYLWDPLVACDSNIEGEGAATSLATGFTGSDNEAIAYTNMTGSDQNLVIEIDVWSGSIGSCASYDLQVTGAGMTTPGPLGTNYCMQNVNSTGQIGTMSGFGLASVAANDCTLTASNLPNNQFGIFVVSALQGFVPNAGGSSNGNICLGGLVGRYNQSGQILSSGGTGSFSLTINLPTIPQGSAPVATNAGDTWNFQAWFRDGVGLGSNFTDGLEIMFTQ